jgi:hypothetical protein
LTKLTNASSPALQDLPGDSQRTLAKAGGMWDSGVRKALKLVARETGCDFPGFGMHSFRRANITIRQEEGGSAIEANKTARQPR